MYAGTETKIRAWGEFWHASGGTIRRSMDTMGRAVFLDQHSEDLNHHQLMLVMS